MGLLMMITTTMLIMASTTAMKSDVTKMVMVMAATVMMMMMETKMSIVSGYHRYELGDFGMSLRSQRDKLTKWSLLNFSNSLDMVSVADAIPPAKIQSAT